MNFTSYKLRIYALRFTLYSLSLVSDDRQENVTQRGGTRW